MTIAELIAALEAATEPSRELDKAIADLVFTQAPSQWIAAPYMGRDIEIPMWRYPDGGVGMEIHFTSSLDAALTLVPSGAYWLLGAGKTRPDEPLYGAQVFRPGREKPIGAGESDVAPATAFSIACLRAREPRIKGDE